MSDAIRIAIHAAPPAAADALFDAVAERAGRKHLPPLRRAAADGTENGADVSLYSVTADGAAPESEIAADKAALKFLIAPAARAEALAKLVGVIVLALEDGDDLVKLQARAVVKGLKENASRLPSAGGAQQRGGKKDAKRAAKKAKRSERKSVVAVAAPEAAPARAPLDRAGKKQAKRAAKQVKRGERKGKVKSAEPATAAPPAAAVPVARDEKKEAKRAAKKAKRGDRKGKTEEAAPAATGDRSEKKQAKRAAKQAKRGERKNETPDGVPAADVPAAEVPAAEVPAVVAAFQKDRGAKKKAKRAVKKQKRVDLRTGAAADAPPPKSREEKKEAKLAAKAAKRGQRRSGKNKSPKDAKAAKDPKDRSAKKDTKRKVREGRIAEHNLAKEQGLVVEAVDTVYEYRLSGLGETATAALATALQAVFQKAGATLDTTRGKADFALFAFDDPALGPDEIRAMAATIADGDHRTAVFLERASPDSEDVNRAIAGLAADTAGVLIRLSSLLCRHGIERGTAEAYVLMANAVLGLCAGDRVPRHGAGRVAGPVPPDLAEARAAIAAPATFFEQGWSDPAPPKLIRAAPRKDEVEAFLDSKLLLPSEELRDFALPIDWTMELPDRRAQLFLAGLEFLHAPLMYWYGKANGQTGEQYVQVTAALKQRGAVPAQILSRAGEIIVDFARKHPVSAMSEAWSEKAVTRRAPVLAAYALCCRAAVRRKIRFDETLASTALASLFDAIELLRADDFYEPRSLSGVRQDCLLAGLGLSLRKTAYGERVIADALTRLKTLQLDLGLTPEGVWREGGFGTHCQVLSEISTLLVDIGNAEAVGPIATDAKRMTVFVEALVKTNGYPLPIDITKPRSYAETLSSARRALAGIGMGSAKAAQGAKSALKPRMMDTYVFREAQYFVSMSSQKVSVEGSHVVLHADRAAPGEDDPGGLSLAFAFGARDLLVRALPEKKRKSKSSRGTLYDPAMRGGYRIDGEGYVDADALGARAARIVKSWRGPGWAAARCVDDLYAQGKLARTVVHLKAQHALVVIDELSAPGSEAEFEQSWHVGSELEPPAAGAALRFGNMAVAFDRGEVELRAEPPGLTRRFRLAEGVVASVFQWTDDPAAAPRIAVSGDGEGWTVAASGTGFAARLLHRGGELQLELEGAAVGGAREPPRG